VPVSGARRLDRHGPGTSRAASPEQPTTSHQQPRPTTGNHTTGSTTATTRQINKVRERLVRIQDELRRVRATERVLADQVAYLAEVDEDAETRKIVAQTPLADREWRDARTDLDRHRALLEDARREADDLLSERDRLLDRLFELETAPRRRDDT
jgi:chromosome segregation ATPase